MTLHPEVEAMLASLEQGQPAEPAPLDVQEIRDAFAAAVVMTGRPAMDRVHDDVAPGPDGDIALRVYRPGPEVRPGIVFFHGGGFVVGTLDMVDGMCRELAARTDAVVVSVDYRLAPEARFPAAADDAYAAFRHVADDADRFGIDATRIAVAGESAGGNLAAVTALRARDEDGPQPAAQLLVYPVTDSGCDTASHARYAEGYMLTRDAMRWFWDMYIGPDGDRTHPYAAPLRADLSGLPPATIVTASHDVLCDEGRAYARRLAESGVPVRDLCYGGMIHGFVGLHEVLEPGRRALEEMCQALASDLARTPQAR